MKQTEIARKYGITPYVLNKMLNGKINPKNVSARIAVKLSSILALPVEDIINAHHTKLKSRFYELYEFHGADNGEAQKRQW
jgi:transcriptional regulator with XRE-family HTH domain